MRGVGSHRGPQGECRPDGTEQPVQGRPSRIDREHRHRDEFGDQAAQDLSGPDLDPEVDAIAASAIAAANRTGDVSWRSNDSRKSASSASRAPVTVETTVRRNGPIASLCEGPGQPGHGPGHHRRVERCETGSRVAAKPRSRARAMTALTATAGPETTVWRRALRPAIATGSPLRSASTSSWSASTLAMAPASPPRSVMAWPRAAAIRSKVSPSKAPAQCKRGELAQTVTDGDLGLDPEFVQQVQGRHRRGDNRRLRHGGRTKIAVPGEIGPRVEIVHRANRLRQAPPSSVTADPWPGKTKPIRGRDVPSPRKTPCRESSEPTRLHVSAAMVEPAPERLQTRRRAPRDGRPRSPLGPPGPRSVRARWPARSASSADESCAAKVRR